MEGFGLGLQALDHGAQAQQARVLFAGAVPSGRADRQALLGDRPVQEGGGVGPGLAVLRSGEWVSPPTPLPCEEDDEDGNVNEY